MPLDKSCNQFLGRLLYVFPSPEWWEYLQLESHPIETPKKFSFALQEILLFEKNPVACIGKVVGPSFANFFICALVRSDDMIDFADHVGPYNILIAPTKPYLTGLKAPPHSESAKAEGHPFYMGYGDVSQDGSYQSPFTRVPS